MPLANVFTLTCREASRLSSDQLDRQLAMREAVAARLHRAGCVSCRRFAGQLRALDAALRRAGGPPRAVPGEEEAGLTDEARDRIRRGLPTGDPPAD